MTTSLTPAERYAWESIVIAELDSAVESPRVIRPVQPTVTRNVRRSLPRRVATSQFAADVQRHPMWLGGGLAVIGCGIHSLGVLVGAW